MTGSDVSVSIHAEHGKNVVAGGQVRRGELGWRSGDCPKVLRTVVKLQLFPIREFAGIDSDGDIRTRVHGWRPRPTRPRRGDGQRVVMGGIGPVK